MKKSEWSGVVKAILDKDDAKKDAKELAKELGDILEINIDANPENLKQLTDEFNQQLVKIGKQPIVFSEKTLQGIVSQFATAIAEGFTRGVKTGIEGLGKVDKTGVADALQHELEGLKRQRAEIVKQRQEITHNVKAKRRLGALEDFNINEAHPIPIDDGENIGEKAKKIVDDLYNATKKIAPAAKKFGEESKEYHDAVLDAQEAYHKYLRMRKDMGRLKNSQLFAIPKDVRASYDRLGQDGRYDYEEKGGKIIPFEEEDFADDLFDGYDKLSDYFDEYVDNAKELDNQLKSIDEKIEGILQKIRNVGQADGLSDDAQKGLKTLREIEEAYGRIAKKAKGNGDGISGDIASAVDYVPGSESLTVLYNRYNAARINDDNWEIRYQWMVKFVKEYEAYLAQIDAEEDKLKKRNMRARLKKYTETYNEVKPMADTAEEMLRQVGQIAGVQFTNDSNVAKTGNISDTDGIDQVAETEIKVKAEKEIEESLNRQRIEAENIAKANEATEKIAAEKVASEEKANTLLLEQKEILVDMLRTSNEVGLFFNSQTGDTSDIIEGGAHSVETTLGAWRQASTQYDTRMHKHNFNVAAPSISGKDNDFATWIKGFDHIKRQMILANTEILSFDFSSLSKETLQNIATLYSQAARKIDQEFDGYIKNRQIGEVFGTLDNMDEQYQVRLQEVLVSIMEKYPGVMTSYKLPSDIISASKDGTFNKRVTGSYKDQVEPIKRETNAHKQNIETIKDETEAKEKLNNVQNQNINIDDDAEVVAKENGALEDKLELLRDIAEQYGNNISQKQRDRYEELNQKDMDSGLTPKEDERYWELGEQIDEADSALEEFGQTYDKIIVKLENGKRVEILPDDKGLRTLAKINDEYGESYNGIEIEDVVFERIQKEATAAEQAVDSLNNSIKETGYLSQEVDGKVDTGDASSADLEAERTKNEALQTELTQKNQQLADKDAEITRIQLEKDAEMQASNSEKATLQSDLEIANQQLKIAQDGEVSARARAYESELAVSEKDEIIQGLREQLANVKSGSTEPQESVKTEELRNILSAITYNVKVVQDAETVDNKVSIDEASLETTLNRVFTNILNPPAQKDNDDSGNEPWALESTLNTTIKSVLDNIQINTSKIGNGEASSSDNDIVAKLTEIKSVLDSINGKTVKGTAPKPVSQPKAPVQTKSGNQSNAKTLIKDYERLGKLRAQFERDGNLETQAQLQNLAAEVKRKRESLKLTTDEIIELRKRSDVAYESEKKLLDAAEKQKKINEERKTQQKADVKAEKQRLANAKKMAQREAMLGKAGNAVGKAENTWMNAAGIDGDLSIGFVAEVDTYYEKLDALRKKHNELKHSDMISEEQKKDLIAQTASVNKLTNEIGELVAEHQRLSGDNATVIGTSALGNSSGLEAYKQQLTQAVMAATNGKAQIKGFDATTKTLNYTVKTGAHEFTEYSAAVRRTDNALVSVQGATKRTETFIEATMRKMKEISSYMSGMSLLSRMGQELRRGIQYVREIDSALTELKKVTDETKESYDEFLDTAAKTANKIGSTIKDVVSSTADFARLGYSMSEAHQMAETAQVLMNVSEFTDISTATDSLISSIQAFKYTAEESMDVVDILNTIGKKNCRGYIVIYNRADNYNG